MKTRCDNPGATGFANYGGRGIFYVARWALFENFVADMGWRPRGMSLDRIDANGPYSPENCRWATRREQAMNKRNTVYVTFEGREWKLDELSKHLGLNRDTLSYRLRRGWSDGQIRNTPATRGNCLKVTLGWHHRVPWNKGIKWSKKAA
jgi:hypothetical protein